MSDFKPFAAAVAAQFAALSKHELFTTDISGDDVYAAYLAAFPAGTNPIFRERTEHDCSCCKNFIRNIGNVVAIVNGTLKTVWDFSADLQNEYGTVATALAEKVRAAKITGVYRAEMPSYGAETSKEQRLQADGKTFSNITWNHFHAKIGRHHLAGKDAAARIGEANAIAQVMRRGLDEIVPDDIETVLDLIASKSLYRGEEHLPALTAFRDLLDAYRSLNSQQDKDLFIWTSLAKPAARFRNTVIGSLLTDLASGVELEAAVKAFEAKVAPENYKRPNALITPRMVQDAMKTVESLGLEPALHRRMARIDDVSVNDIAFVDNAVRGRMKDSSIAGLLMDAAQPTYVAEPANSETIGIDKFMAEVLPKASSLAVLVKNAHQANFVTLTAPAIADAPHIFKWNNGFAWSYDGNITDSIKERVKAKGGKTDAALRISLAWFNKDDLDIHVFEPNGNHIYFGNKGRRSMGTGMLDVDMNMMTSGSTYSATEPVENVTWTAPKDGVYRVVVNNYNQRTNDNAGFTLEVENNGAIHQYTSQVSPKSSNSKTALHVHVLAGKVVKIDTESGINGGAFSQEKWGVKTESFVKVNTVMLSPNHWGDAGQGMGNKHYLFMLDGCKNPVPTRGIYNEFLLPALEKHRKVFEVLGNKTMCDPTDDQLSGVGFSSTRGDSVTVQVNGRRCYIINF